MIESFLAGAYFPLDILPKPIFAVFQLLPFGYSLYFPLKVYLGQLSLTQIYFGLLISIVWVFGLLLIAQFVWTKGLKVYTAWGK